MKEKKKKEDDSRGSTTSSSVRRQRGPYGPRCSPKQWQAILDFISDEPAMGKQYSELKPDLRAKLWQRLAEVVNDIGPARRSVEDWRRLWYNRVATARLRVAEAFAQHRLTGGKPADAPAVLADSDVRITNIIGVDSLIGDFEVPVTKHRPIAPAPPAAKPVTEAPSQTDGPHQRYFVLLNNGLVAEATADVPLAPQLSTVPPPLPPPSPPRVLRQAERYQAAWDHNYGADAAVVVSPAVQPAAENGHETAEEATAQPILVAAQPGHKNRTEGTEEDDYQVIMPQLPSGDLVRNTVFLHGDPKARPYHVEDFRDMLGRAGMLLEVTGLGAYQLNHVWAVTFQNAEGARKMLAGGDQRVKGHRCLVIDPKVQRVKLKLHGLLPTVPDADVLEVLATYGTVTEIARDYWKVLGVRGKDSTSRTVQLKLKSGLKVADLPHEIRVRGELALVVVAGRPVLCLRCGNSGHARRDCTVPRCSWCRRFGHAAAQCVRPCASVLEVPEAEEDSVQGHLMDASEAEEAARGAGDEPSSVVVTVSAPLQDATC